MVLSFTGELLIPVSIIAFLGISITLFSVIKSIRLVSKNKMGGTVVGRLITVLCIAWSLTVVAAAIFGMAWYFEITAAEHILLVVMISCLPWTISSFLTLRAVRKWSKEAA